MIDILSNQIKGSISNAVFNQVIGLGLPVNNSILRAISSRVAEEVAVFTTSSVNLNTNKQLNNIPQNTLGTNNPVNITTGNLGTSGITSNLGNIINTQLNSQITNLLVNSLQRELTAILPADKLGIINFSGIAATLVQSLTPTISNSISTVLNGVVGSIFNRNQSTPLSLPSLNSIFDTATRRGLPSNSIQYQGLVNNHYSESISRKYFNTAKNFDINNSSNKEKLVTLKQGFTDPNANYPTKEYSGKSETNKLAQGDIKGTVVQEKNSSRMLGAKLPGGDYWDQPESPYKGEYPYNKVTQTEGGHILEMDDTPGSERIHLYHKSGTFVEIDVNGSVVMRTKGSKYQIIDRNGKIAISGSADISINGACNIFVGNDANIEVEGNTNITCHNDITAQAGGKFNLSAVEEFNISSGNVNIQAYHAMNVKSNVSLLFSTSKELNIRSNTNAYVQATNFYQNTTNSYHQTLTNMYEKIGDTKYTQAMESVHYKLGGNFNVDGDNVYLNSNTAQSSQNSKSANVAGPSNIGVLTGRKDVTDNSARDPVSINLADTYALRLEEEPTASGELAAQKDLILTSGFSTSEEFEKAPLVVESSADKSALNDIIIPSLDLKKYKELPGNFNLSPNFTVEMLSSKAALTKYFIIGIKNVTYGEIVYNLSSIALNILEPAYNVYPSLFVASGFRTKQASSKNSLHPIGKCVDIQFQGASKEEYYEYAKQLARILNYDQLILEYCNYTKNPWIHISFQGSNNRKQIMTFWNNRKYSDNIAKLV